MAFDKKPSTWLGAGYAASAENHTITLNTADAASDKTVPELADAEADPTTGDVRKLVFALMEMLYAAWAAQAAVDRPTKLTIYKSSSVSGSTITHTYTVVTVNDINAQDVADEPA
jgi:hypothetical protein